ncbi:MAG: carboxypeptidase M32 [Chlamydiales bacterium]
MKEFDTLFGLSKRASLLQGISHLLEWDQETSMPPGAAEIRSEQIELLAALTHKERTSAAFVQALSHFIDLESGKVRIADLKPWQKAALREWLHDLKKARALPASFVSEFAKLTALGIVIWAEARKENDFKKFAPHLKKIVAMNQKKADYLGYKEHLYDALLDLFEPGCTTKQISTIFQKLGKEVKELVQMISQKPPIDDSCLMRAVARETQLHFGEKLLQAMGYEMKFGRLDLSTHPFSTSMHPTDSRVTTRIQEGSLFDCISAVLHEGGHGLYEMGLDPEYYGCPIGESRSLGIHESQSRWWETRIGQSRAFWKHFFPLLQKSYRGNLEHTELNTFYRAINKVTPSFIRVEADEVTYSLHVILRFEIEKQLIEGELSVTEVPEAWNSMMESLLGISPPSDSKGCLQDIHWSMGAFGYFPTYTLGNLYCAEFFDAFAKKHPDWESRVAKGELLFIKEWQNKEIHKYGRMYSTKELLKRVTGKTLSIAPYMNYLKKKYHEIYNNC